MTQSVPAPSLQPAPQLPFELEHYLRTLPHRPGVYQFLDATATVIYVGKARDLKRRVLSYFSRPQDAPRLRMMLSQIQRIEVTLTGSEIEALLLEINLIKALQPRFNILFRDDKSYPYLRFSSHPFPRLGLYRGPLAADASHFGPYPSAWAARETLGHLQKLFQLRTCEDAVFRARSRPCLLHQIQRCSAPCVNLIQPEHYARDLQQAQDFLSGRESTILDDLRIAMLGAAAKLDYEQAARLRDRIALIQQTLARQSVTSVREEGDADVIAACCDQEEAVLHRVMIRAGRHLGGISLFPEHAAAATPEALIRAFILQHYTLHPPPRLVVTIPLPDGDELAQFLSKQSGQPIKVVAGRSGERRGWLHGALENARFALEQKKSRQHSSSHRIKALQQALQLEDPPRRIEGFDISHTQGEATVASCVVFVEGVPFKTDYRRFNISGITPGDDLAAIRQVLQRRFRDLASGAGQRPDLVLIDGGRTQLQHALGVLQELGLEGLPVIGIAKGSGRKPELDTLVSVQLPELKLAPEHPGRHLVQAVRDEAHRFALNAHRARRTKSRFGSSLESIPGIGAQRRQLLLARFGGLRGVGNASIEDLASITGIGPALAAKIWHALH